MSLLNCIPLGLGTRSRSSSGHRGDHEQSHKYSGKNLFEGKNYQAILECLDGGKFFFFLISISFQLFNFFFVLGYKVANCIIESMEEYLKLRRESTEKFITYS